MLKILKKIKIIFFEKYYFDDWVIESRKHPINLEDAIDLVLNFNENEDEYEDEYEDDDDKTIDQNEIKKLNNYFDKIIGKSKPFKDQIKSLKKEVKKNITLIKIMMIKS